MYFSNSHESRDLPIPAVPTIDSEAGAAVVRGRVEELLGEPSSRSRPTNGDSTPTERPSPPRFAITRSACQSCTGSAFPFSSRSPAAWYATAASVARRVESPTSTVPASRRPGCGTRC